MELPFTETAKIRGKFGMAGEGKSNVVLDIL